ncbi:MAG: carboxypeptidase regulatory-like domain-containing protein [Gemmatimonadota bacterium]
MNLLTKSHVVRLTRSIIPALSLVLFSATGLISQATNATIGGNVRSATGEPLRNTNIQLRNESTGFEAGALTNGEGNFTLRQLPLGGPYAVTATQLGYRSEVRTDLQLSLGDQVRIDFRLEPSAVDLEPIVVTASAAGTHADRAGASTLIRAEEVNTLPVADRDFTNLASLSPLNGPGITLGGAQGTSTAVRLDGVSVRQNRLGRANGAGPAVMSLEAVREFEVSTNDYDVTQGRQGGGAINVASKFGTNEWEGSVFSNYRNEDLTTVNYAGRTPDEFDLTQWGGSFSGPILRDRLHFFIAGERRQESAPTYVFDIQSPDDEVIVGIAQDSLARFLDIVQRQYGVSSEPQVGAFTRRTVNNMLFGRLDWQIAPGHRLTLRNNYVDFDGGEFGGLGPTIFEAKGREAQRTNAAVLSLRSTPTSALLNELSLHFVDVSSTRVAHNGYLPQALVRIRSDLPDGTTGNRLVQFGGNRQMPADLPERQFQLANTSYLDLGNQTITFGTDNLLTLYQDEYVAQEQIGRFEFNSLADLEAMQPFRYSRQAPLGDPYPSATQNILDLALFGQTEFQPTERISATLGLRYDVSMFLRNAAYNPEVEQELGIRTDREMAVDWDNLQPRAQLTWDVRGDGTETFKAGFGSFVAQPHHAPFYNSILFTGLSLGDVTLTGNSVPAPEFTRFREDPLSIPGVPAGVATAPAHVELIASDFKVPAIWKANASYSRRFLDRLTLGANVLVSRTSDNYRIVNQNLVEEPYFTIEGDRGVFVPANTIGSNGIVNTVNARKSQAVANVFELGSGASARQWGFILDGALELPGNSSISGSYTYNDAENNNFWNCCLTGTGINNPVKGDPRDLSGSWGPSDWDVRHKVVGYGVLPALWGFRLSGRYVGSSGAPFSLVVNSDINADGSSNNDLAYVFDPDDPSTPSDVAEGIRNVIDNSDSFAAACVEANLGRIADRASCRAPWSSRIDVRIARTLPSWRGQRAELVIDVFNFAHLLSSEWGGRYAFGNRQQLLRVDGFDPLTERFQYSVNENVGVTRRSGDPYQIQLGVRYSF